MGVSSEAIDWRAWNLRATHEEEYRPFPDLGRRNLYQEALEVPTMVRALGLPRRQRVLEVGCGRGVALAPLLRWLRPKRLTGLDVDPGLLQIAGAKLGGLSREHELALVEGDVRELPFPSGSFDIVIDFGTCYHVARRERALREIARVLAPGGLFVHETRASQLLSHPVRSWGRRLPWRAVPQLVPGRHALLWATRVKAGPPA
ncbi:MAG: class I SAM-dependent methyltransferase [Vicinamibacterales bacterium]|jgi:ubiquinone/menaquinone biosynthesis C-methylase UbiE